MGAKQFLIALGILSVGELLAYSILKERGHAFGLFIQPQGLKEDTEGFQGVGYDEADPLLGWGMSHEKLISMGHPVEHGMPVLTTDGACDHDTLRILVTGGSTSDLTIDRKNWPVDLTQMLQDSGICAKVYVGAVGGYTSGQEMLKVLRDGILAFPDIHISYSGANEPSAPSFVSPYEEKVFSRIMETRSTVLLPNLIFFLRYKLGMVSGLGVHHSEPTDAASFWLENMKTMNAIASSRGYTFIGILQPVLGTGKVNQPIEMEEWADLIAEYRSFYQNVGEEVGYRPYLEDMTDIFDGVTEPVYIDDCHLQPEMQPIVAAKVLQLILRNRNSSQED